MKISAINLVLSVILVSSKMQQDSAIKPSHLTSTQAYGLHTLFKNKANISLNEKDSMSSIYRNINVQQTLETASPAKKSSEGLVTVKSMFQASSALQQYAFSDAGVFSSCIGSSCYTKTLSSHSPQSSLSYSYNKTNKNLEHQTGSKHSSEIQTSAYIDHLSTNIIPSFISTFTKYSLETPKLETMATSHHILNSQSVSLSVPKSLFFSSKHLPFTSIYSSNKKPLIMLFNYTSVDVKRNKVSSLFTRQTGPLHHKSMENSYSNYKGTMHYKSSITAKFFPMSDTVQGNNHFSTIHEELLTTISNKPYADKTIIKRSRFTASKKVFASHEYKLITHLASLSNSMLHSVRNSIKTSMPHVSSNLLSSFTVNFAMKGTIDGNIPTIVLHQSKQTKQTNIKRLSATFAVYKQSSFPVVTPSITRTASLSSSSSSTLRMSLQSTSSSYSKSWIHTSYISSDRNVKSSESSKQFKTKDRPFTSSKLSFKHLISKSGSIVLNKTVLMSYPAKSNQLINSEIQNTYMTLSISASSKQIQRNMSIQQSLGILKTAKYLPSSSTKSQKHVTLKTVNLNSTVLRTRIFSSKSTVSSSVYVSRNSFSKSIVSNIYTKQTSLRSYSMQPSQNINSTQVSDATSGINSKTNHRFTSKTIHSSYRVSSHNTRILDVTVTISSRTLYSQCPNISSIVKLLNFTASNLVSIPSTTIVFTNKMLPANRSVRNNNITVSKNVIPVFTYISSTTDVYPSMAVPSTTPPTRSYLPSLLESSSEKTMALTITIPPAMLKGSEFILLVQEYHKDNYKDVNITTWHKTNAISHYRYYKYRALRLNVHSRRKRSLNNSKLVHIGYNSRCSTSQNQICNGPLNAGSGYRFQIEVHFGKDILYTPFTIVHYTKRNHVYANDANSTILIVLSVLLVCFVVLTLAILAVIFRRRNRGRGVCGSSEEVRSTLMTPCNKSSTKSRKKFTGPDILMERKKSIKGMTRPVSVRDFQAWVSRSCSDSDFRFAEEFESMRDVGKLERHEVADMQENRGKNRYVNVLSYDYTRVKLSSIDDEPGSDYINANYIHGYKQPRAYIATQGPLPSTTDDFWRMTWEQNSRIIVMVTQCTERAKVKCHQYWPTTEPTRYGDIVVTLVTETSYSEWIEREFHLEYEKETRKLRHFQYIGWPDHGVPKTTNEMLEFVQTVKYYKTTDDGPLICHCSAGIGRTGTYLCIDILINKLQYENNVDVYGVVCIMRTQRSSMVQTEDQYIFIHRVILHHLKQRDEKQQIFSGYSTLTLERKERKVPKVEREEASLDIEEPNVNLLNKSDFLSEFDNELYVSRVYDSST